MSDQSLTLDLPLAQIDVDSVVGEADFPNQFRLAELLDQYACLLEEGDETGAEELLRSYPELLTDAGGPIESLQMLCRMTRSATKQAEAVDAPSRPRTLGDYELHQEIGRGGMGIVYEATQLSLRRNVALKVLPFAAVLNQDQVIRFKNEAHAAASLHHPHIVPVYGVGCERGVHYYSMQLINGNTLEQTLDELRSISCGTATGSPNDETRNIQSPQTTVADHVTGVSLRSVRERDGIREIVEMFVDVTDAIDYAHQQGVIHRDIKPSNLLVDSAGKVWVADFGLARCRDASNLTAEGKLMGTVRYMSPEQIAGRPQQVDHRTDIYSLGITLYELLTLQPAFSETVRQRLLHHVEFDPPIAPRRINPTIPTDLETIVLKAVAKAKDDRYATCGELADDLRRFLNGQPTSARRPSTLDLCFRWAVRHRLAVLFTLAVLVLTIVGFGIATAVVSHHSRQKDLAMQEAYHYLDQAHSAVERFGGLMSSRLESIQGGEQLRQELLTEARNYYTDFIRYAGDRPSLRSELSKVQFLLGVVESKLGRDVQAETAYQSAIIGFEALSAKSQLDAESHTDFAICIHNLAAIQKRNGRYEQAFTQYQRAMDVYEQAMRASDPTVDPTRSDVLLASWGATQTNFAKLLWETGRSSEAVERLRSAEIKLADRVAKSIEPGHVTAQLIECRNTLAGLLMDHEPDQAERLLRENIATIGSEMQCLLKPSLLNRTTTMSLENNVDPSFQLALAQNNLASLLGRQQRTDEAIALTLKSIATLERAASADLVAEQQLAIVQNNYGQLLYRRGADEEARAAFNRAEQIFRSMGTAAKNDAHLLSRCGGVLHNLGVLDQRQGKLDQAIAHLTDAMEFQALAVRQAPSNQSFREYLEMHNKLLDQVLRQLKEEAESLPASTSSLDDSESPLGKANVDFCKERINGYV